MTALKRAPHTVEQMLAFCQREWKHRSRDWTNDCQMFWRMAWGDTNGGWGSAIEQWENTPAKYRIEGGNPNKVPVGWGLCYIRKDGKGYGHIMPAKHPFPNGTGAAWSNDLGKTGFISPVARTAPMTKWGHKYLGAVMVCNEYVLPVKELQHPTVNVTEAIARAAALNATLAKITDPEAKRIATAFRSDIAQHVAELRKQEVK